MNRPTKAGGRIGALHDTSRDPEQLPGMRSGLAAIVDQRLLNFASYRKRFGVLPYAFIQLETGFFPNLTPSEVSQLARRSRHPSATRKWRRSTGPEVT